MRRSIIIPFALIFSTLVCFQAWADDWQDMGDGSYFDVLRIVKTRQKTLVAWIKCVLPVQLVQRQASATHNNYNEYSYTVFQYEYKCDSREYRTKAFIDYDKSGTVIQGSFSDKEQYETVVPRSNAEVLLSTICDHANNDNSKK